MPVYETVGRMYADVGRMCKYETVGCMYADVGRMSMKRLGAYMRMLGACLWNGWVHVCRCWVHVYGTVGCMYADVGCLSMGRLDACMLMLGASLGSR